MGWGEGRGAAGGSGDVKMTALKIVFLRPTEGPGAGDKRWRGQNCVKKVRGNASVVYLTRPYLK